MRPIQLKLTAFGPYKNTEIIDFRELEDRKLYVISGNTGAGKTTIFDGICFALYGSASGSDRDENRFLRSDFADDTVPTSAELIFELNGRTYRILRQPGHIKQGNKTKTGENYEFFEMTDGGENPVVERQIVSEIDRKIETIIGLTQDQFKQIVMLPQGEFRKLLTSETGNKENILRSLFKTSKYNDLNGIVQARRQHAKEAFEKAQHKEGHFVQSISTALPKREGSALSNALENEFKNTGHIAEGLQQEIEFYEQQIDTETGEYEKSSEQLANKQETFYKAQHVNELFDEKARKQGELEELQSQSSTYEDLEKQLQLAKKAEEIEWQENQEKQLERNLEEKTAISETAQKKYKKAEEALSLAAQQLELEKDREVERKTIEEEAVRLRELLPLIEKLQASDQKQKQLEQKKNETAVLLQKEEESRVQKAASLEEEGKRIRDMERSLDALPAKKSKCEDLRRLVVSIRNYTAVSDEYEAVNERTKQETASYEDALSNYNNTEQEWLNGQAAILAGHLHEGEACPVCGSAEHPHKADTAESGVSREMLNKAKNELEQKEKRFHEAKIALQSKAAQLDALASELETSGINRGEIKEKYNQLVEEGKPLAAEVKKLEEQHAKLPGERLKYEKSETEYRRQTEHCNELERNYYEYKSAFETALNAYKGDLERIPEHLRAPGKLENQLRQLEQKSAQLKEAFELASANSEKAKSELAGWTAEIKNAQSNFEEAKSRHLQAMEQFAASLRAKGFDSIGSYHLAKMPLQEREQKKTRLEAYKQSLGTLHTRIAELEAKLEGKEPQLLDQMQSELALLKEANEKALQQLNNSKQYFAVATELLNEFAKTGREIQYLEKEYAVVTDLYDTLRGQNQKKISFERYLQIEYLEQIIEAANERLHELSNGQYRLMHSNRQESRGKASGLGLDVYDAYTGQTRDVKTLSGGEKFNASLCLALGMSDVIQSFQGNVSIETMFIDEGFGSLDEESLHKAIDTLIGLQKSGRMIGVISHVEELKAMFPAILEVKKTKEGYSKTKFIVK